MNIRIKNETVIKRASTIAQLKEWIDEDLMEPLVLCANKKAAHDILFIKSDVRVCYIKKRADVYELVDVNYKKEDFRHEH